MLNGLCYAKKTREIASLYSMKVLILTKKFPYPPKDGESIAVDSLTRSLHKLGCEITLLSMNTTKHFVEVEKVEKEMPQYQRVETSTVDNAIKPLAALKNLFSDRSYHIERFDDDRYREKLKAIVQQDAFDIVLLETIYLAPYIDTIRANSHSSIVLRAHNIEHEIWDRIADQTTQPLKKWYLSLLVRRLQRYEYDQAKKVDGLVAFTDRDMEKFERAGFTEDRLVVPIGIDTERYTAMPIDSAECSIGFIGSLDWQPNIEGLLWFVESVWPIVIARYPDAECHIAGRNPSEKILNLSQKGIVVHGEVEDAQAFVKTHPISIVPLLSGSGMRVKILEAMALERCIISTSVGAEGIISDGLLIADTVKTFAERLIELLSDPKKIYDLGHKARSVVMQHYDSKSNAQRLHQFLVKIKSHDA